LTSQCRFLHRRLRILSTNIKAARRTEQQQLLGFYTGRVYGEFMGFKPPRVDVVRLKTKNDDDDDDDDDDDVQ